MKNVILLAISTFIVSCSTMTFSPVWSVDSMGKYTCDSGNVLSDSMIGTILTQSDEKLKESMAKVGYSNCEIIRTEASLLTTCKTPIAYKSLITKNMAECHKFLQETKNK